eukprot:COSAG05_NODE_57_length_23291_cov_75.862668_34_plen_64_part_00
MAAYSHKLANASTGAMAKRRKGDMKWNETKVQDAGLSKNMLQVCRSQHGHNHNDDHDHHHHHE